jgi:predicted secreted protein
MMPHHAAAVILLAFVATAHAAPPEPLPSTGTLIVLPALGEVHRANDQVTVTLKVEEIHKDKAVAASRVNQKMKQGTGIVKNADPQASLKTDGYYTYPVYPETTTPAGAQSNQARVPVSWRVGQTLRVTTTNLDALPRTVAAAQSVLALTNLYFSLTPASIRKLDDERIAATYVNLNERVRALAGAMGRQASDAVVEMVDFEGSGNYAEHVSVTGSKRAPAPAPPAPSGAMVPEEPSFEPGETTLTMRAVGKVRFK